MKVKASELVKGDEIMINEEVHRITTNNKDEYHDERKMKSYPIDRPRGPAYWSWYNNDREVEVLNR